MSDMVNGPKHYRGDRVMRIIEEFGLGFKDGNVIKYVLRYPEKNGVEDLKKARWYLDRLIAEKEGALAPKPVDATPAEPESDYDSLKVGDIIMSCFGKTLKVEAVFRDIENRMNLIRVRFWPQGGVYPDLNREKYVRDSYRKVAKS